MPADEARMCDAEQLLSRLGMVSEDEVRERFADTSSESLIAWGAKVSTPRIASDGWVMLGEASAFLDKATAEQKAHLPTLSAAHLSLTATATKLASERYGSRQESLRQGAEAKEQVAALTESDRQAIIARRNVLYHLVKIVAGEVEPLKTRIGQVYSRSEDPADLAATIDSLASIGDALLKEKSPAIVKRRKTTSLSKDWLDESRALARKAEAAARAQGQRPVPAHVSQAEVDLFDGYALTLLGELVEAFEVGHGADPTIPRLSLHGLRSLLRPPRGKRPSADDKPGDKPAEPAKPA